jgi:hypothetical protein
VCTKEASKEGKRRRRRNLRLLGRGAGKHTILDKTELEVGKKMKVQKNFTLNS